MKCIIPRARWARESRSRWARESRCNWTGYSESVRAHCQIYFRCFEWAMRHLIWLNAEIQRTTSTIFHTHRSKWNWPARNALSSQAFQRFLGATQDIPFVEMRHSCPNINLVTKPSEMHWIHSKIHWILVDNSAIEIFGYSKFLSLTFGYILNENSFSFRLFLR